MNLMRSKGHPRGGQGIQTVKVNIGFKKCGGQHLIFGDLFFDYLGNIGH